MNELFLVVPFYTWPEIPLPSDPPDPLIPEEFPSEREEEEEEELPRIPG